MNYSLLDLILVNSISTDCMIVYKNLQNSTSFGLSNRNVKFVDCHDLLTELRGK